MYNSMYTSLMYIRAAVCNPTHLMAPSAACGKAFFLILVCVIKLAVGLAVRRWRAESRRRIQQAAAVGLTFGQIDVYTILIHRALKVFTWWSISDL